MTNKTYTEEQMEGIMALTVAEMKLRQLADYANSATNYIDNAACELADYADRKAIKVLSHEALEIMLQADQLARKIQQLRKEVKA